MGRNIKLYESWSMIVHQPDGNIIYTRTQTDVFIFCQCIGRELNRRWVLKIYC